MISEDTVISEMTGFAEKTVLPELLALYPESPSDSLTRVVYDLVLATVDKVMRPKRKEECELLMALEDVFTGLNSTLQKNNVDTSEFKFSILESSDGPTVDIQVVLMDKVMTHFHLRAAMLVPMLNKRYREQRLNIRV